MTNVTGAVMSSKAFCATIFGSGRERARKRREIIERKRQRAREREESQRERKRERERTCFQWLTNVTGAVTSSKAFCATIFGIGRESAREREERERRDGKRVRESAKVIETREKESREKERKRGREKERERASNG